MSGAKRAGAKGSSALDEVINHEYQRKIDDLKQDRAFDAAVRARWAAEERSAGKKRARRTKRKRGGRR